MEKTSGDRWDGNGPAVDVKVPYGLPSQWDLTLPAVPSAFLSGDPVQIINGVLGIARAHSRPPSSWARSSYRNWASSSPPIPASPTTAAFLWSTETRLSSTSSSGRIAARRSVLVGRRHRGRSEPRHRRWCQHRRLRLLRTDPLRLRRRRDQAAALLGFPVQHGPQDPVVADASRRRHLLRAEAPST